MKKFYIVNSAVDPYPEWNIPHVVTDIKEVAKIVTNFGSSGIKKYFIKEYEVRRGTPKQVLKTIFDKREKEGKPYQVQIGHIRVRYNDENDRERWCFFSIHKVCTDKF